VVSYRLAGQHTLDALPGEVGFGEAGLEGRADQVAALTTGRRFGLAVRVGNRPRRVGRDERVDDRFDERARVELLVAQALVEQPLRVCGLLAQVFVIADHRW